MSIPSSISSKEHVLRTIFDPANFSKKGKLRPNFMRPQFTSPDEVDKSEASHRISVTRYDYVDVTFCRNHAKKHSQKPKRNYWGFAKFLVKDIRDCKDDVESCPVIDNQAHANIIYPFHIPVGVTDDPKIDLMIRNLVNKAEVFKDLNPQSENCNIRKFSDII